MNSIIPEYNEKCLGNIYKWTNDELIDCVNYIMRDIESDEEAINFCNALKQRCNGDIEAMNKKIEIIAKDKFRNPAREDLILYAEVIYHALHLAEKKYSENDINGVWFYLLQGQKWLGILQYICANEWIMKQSLDAFISRAAKKGGIAKSEKYQPIKDELHKLLKDKVVKDGRPWPSAYNAAGKLQDQALEIAKKKGIPLSENAILTRLQEWFNAFEDRDTLFASKRRSQAPKASS